MEFPRVDAHDRSVFLEKLSYMKRILAVIGEDVEPKLIPEMLVMRAKSVVCESP